MPIESIEGVICCGNMVYDVAVWPVDNFDWNTTTWVDHLAENIGGNGANTSYTLAKLGVPVRLVSIAGADDRGERLLDFLNAAGVDVTRVDRSTTQPTPSTVVLVKRDGQRKFFHRPGASRELSAAAVTFPEPGEGITHFHLANPFALPVLREESADLMKEAKRAGLTTSIDTGWDSRGRWMQDLGGALACTDLLFVNDAEAKKLGGRDDLAEAVAAIREHGVPDVIVKTGAQGCSIYTEAGVQHVPAFMVDVVDTTGAGDCFAGGFLAALHEGAAYPECARFANAVGALNVQGIGSTGGVLSFQQTMEWMQGRESRLG